jgi:hypothetical protein
VHRRVTLARLLLSITTFRATLPVARRAAAFATENTREIEAVRLAAAASYLSGSAGPSSGDNMAQLWLDRLHSLTRPLRAFLGPVGMTVIMDEIETGAREIAHTSAEVAARIRSLCEGGKKAGDWRSLVATPGTLAMISQDIASTGSDVGSLALMILECARTVAGETGVQDETLFDRLNPTAPSVSSSATNLRSRSSSSFSTGTSGGDSTSGGDETAALSDDGSCFFFSSNFFGSVFSFSLLHTTHSHQISMNVQIGRFEGHGFVAWGRLCLCRVAAGTCPL